MLGEPGARARRPTQTAAVMAMCAVLIVVFGVSLHGLSQPRQFVRARAQHLDSRHSCPWHGRRRDRPRPRPFPGRLSRRIHRDRDHLDERRAMRRRSRSLSVSSLPSPLASQRLSHLRRRDAAAADDTGFQSRRAGRDAHHRRAALCRLPRERPRRLPAARRQRLGRRARAAFSYFSSMAIACAFLAVAHRTRPFHLRSRRQSGRRAAHRPAHPSADDDGIRSFAPRSAMSAGW